MGEASYRAYADQETSGFRGRPADLFEFSWGSHRAYFTTVEKPVVFYPDFVTVSYEPEREYLPLTSERGSLELTTYSARSDMEVRFTSRFRLARELNNYIHVPVYLTVLRGHVNVTEDTDRLYMRSYPVTIWSGRLDNVDWDSEGTAKAVFKPEESYLELRALRWGCTKFCPKKVYSSACGVDQRLYQRGVTVTFVEPPGTLNSRKTRFICTPDIPYTVNGIDGYYNGGIIQFVGVEGNFRISHVKEWVRIDPPEEQAFFFLDQRVKNLDLISGVISASIYPGCNQLYIDAHDQYLDCHKKFNNSANFGGWPFIDRRNLFTSLYGGRR